MPVFPNATTAASNAAAASAAANLLAAQKEVCFGFTPAGDQITLSNTSKTPFVKVGSALADYCAVGDECEWEAEIWVDGTNGTPAFTCKLELGTAELESQVIATAQANDYVILKGHGVIIGATTMRMYKGEGRTKDGTLSEHTRAAPTDVTIQALNADRAVTASVTSDADHASNQVTLKNLKFKVHKKVVPA